MADQIHLHSIIIISIQSYRHPKGWQGILRTGENGDAYVIIHIFDGALNYECNIEISKVYEYEIEEVYSDSEVQVTLKNRVLTYRPEENWKAVAVYLKRR